MLRCLVGWLAGWGLAVAAHSQTSFIQLDTGAHHGQVVGLASAGKTLFSASWDKTVRAWDIERGSVETLRYPIGLGTNGAATSLASNGTFLVVGTRAEANADASVVVFDQKSRQITRVLEDVTSPVFATFADGGKILAILAGNGTLITLDGRDFQQIGSRAVVSSLAPDTEFGLGVGKGGSSLVVTVSGGKETNVLAVDPKTLQLISKTSVRGYVRTVADTPGGVLLGGSPNLLASWELKGSPNLFKAAPETVTSVGVSGDQAIVAYQRGDRSFWQVWNPTGSPSGAEFPLTAPGMTVQFVADGRWAIGDAIGQVLLVDEKNGKTSTLGGVGRSIGTVAWSAEGTELYWNVDLSPETRRDVAKAGFTDGFTFSRLRTLGPKPTETAVTRLAQSVPAKDIKITQSAVSFQLAGKTVRIPLVVPTTPNDAVPISPTAVAVSVSSSVFLFSQKSAEHYAELAGGAGYILGLAVSPDGRFLAGAGTDQTIRLWKIEGIKEGGQLQIFNPILTLLPGGDGEWVVWDEEKCFYATSPKGDERLGIHTNVSKVRVEFGPAFTMRGKFERPDLVRQIFSQGALPPSVQASAPMREVEGNRPDVRVLDVVGAKAEDDGFVTTNGQVTVRLRVAREIESVALATGNLTKDLRRDDLEEEGGDLRTVKVTLQPGANLVRLVAKNRSGESNPVRVRIRYDAPGFTGAYRVLAIGGPNYDDPTIRALPYNTNDANRIADFFRTQNGRIGEVTVTRVPDNQTKRAQILAAIDTFAKSVKPGDNVIVYVSAHGAPGEGGEGFYMLPSDTNVKNIKGTAIPWADFVKRLSSLDCRNVVLLQDTCHAGGIREAQLQNFIEARSLASRAETQTNLITISSSQPSEPSLVSLDDKGSVFTLALLRALEGQLPLAVQDGFVRLEYLDTPLRREVEDMVRRIFGPETRQRISVTRVTDVDLPLAKVKQ